MEVTSKLMQEHQLILAWIQKLRTLDTATDPRLDDETFFAFLKDTVEFIRSYADHYHHAKEEDILFRYLEKPGVLSHCNPLPVMLHDHEIAREYTAQIALALQNSNRVHALRNALAWAGHLEAHIQKEDQVLYVMAEEGLEDEDKLRIQEEYRLAETANQGSELEIRFKSLLAAAGQVSDRKSVRVGDHKSILVPVQV